MCKIWFHTTKTQNSYETKLKRGRFSWKVSLHHISRSRKTQWRRNWGLWTEPKQNITKFKNSNALFKRQLHNAFPLELKSKSIYLPWNYFQMISCFFGCLALINKGQCAGVFPKKIPSSIVWIICGNLTYSNSLIWMSFKATSQTSL